MLDKIVIHSDRKQACMIFTDRSPINVTSDVDVIPLLLWLLGDSRAKLTISLWHRVTGVELLKDTSNEVTMKIDFKDVV